MKRINGIILIIAALLSLASCADSSSFEIAGKWKNTGSDGFGQAQPGAIIAFDGTNCNFYSPSDTYAFYKDGNHYVLDITSLLFEENLSLIVNVKDKNHLEISGENWIVEMTRLSEDDADHYTANDHIVSENYIEQISTVYNEDSLIDASVGEYVYFGSYEQDNNVTNGNEAIEWLVLEKEEDKILVVSKYALDCQPYNTEWTDITWESCTLRNWLNDIFLNKAFTEEERTMIPIVTVNADNNPDYSTNVGGYTEDQVFLLSISEANHYFGTDDARKCIATDYAITKGALASTWWWLRSPGSKSNYAALVEHTGSVWTVGTYVSNGNDAVRPAMWIDLTANTINS